MSATNFQKTLEKVLQKCANFYKVNNGKIRNFIFYYTGHGNKKYLENVGEYIPFSTFLIMII